MIFRNGIRTTFRAKGRTALFFLLILVLTLSLTLGLGLYAYSSSALSAMDDQYMSIGLVEYMGEDYPDPNAADPDARAAWEALDDQAISQVDGVVSWMPQDRTLALVENYQRLDGTIPYEGWAVVQAAGFYPITNAMGQTLYSARIVKSLYNQNDRGTMMMVDAGDTGFAPEDGAAYLLHGMFVSSGTSNPTLSLVDFDTGEAAFYKLSGDDDPALTDSVFTQRAAYYASANNYVQVTASDMPDALEEFHQGILTLREGRFPQEGEMGVCTVDGQMAGQMKLELGDEIRLTVLDSDENDRFLLSESSPSKSLTVVGITSANVDWSGYLWVSKGEGGFSEKLFGYYLGEAVFENAGARQAAETLRTIVPEGVQVALYDQGYFTAAQPLQAMETTALAVAGASGCGAVAVLVLFGSLFIGRQKETVDILRCLGTPAGKIRLWLLSGAGVISASAAFIGAGAGRLLMGTMIRWALDVAEDLYFVDQRYSESAIGTAISRNEIWELPIWPALASGMAVFGVSMIFCALFLSQALDRSAPKKGREKVCIPHGKTTAFGRGVLRYAPVFAVRSASRSVIVVAASVILTLFLGILLAISQRWQSQMDELYDTAKIHGRATSTNGRQSTNLLVSEDNVRLLWESGMLDEIGVSLGWHYWFPDEIPEFAQGGFGTETRNNWIAQQPQLTALNTLNAAPAFYYEEEVAVDWLEGWDKSCFSDSDYYPVTYSMPVLSGKRVIEGRDLLTYPCVVSTSFLKERGFSLGDSFTVMFRIPIGAAGVDMAAQVQIVGSCAAGKEGEIYVPLSFWMFPENLFGWDASIAADDGPEASDAEPGSDFSNPGESFTTISVGDTNFSTCRFTLTSAQDLDAFRDYLEENSVSQAGKLGNNRMTIVLEDQSFVETVGGLGRLISFCRIVFPALFAAVCLLGFVISWLMTGSRRMEFAILRGLGTSGIRVFFTFFLEQGILCLSGSILGGLILMGAGCGMASLAAAGGFLVCYLAGCALSVFLVEQTNLMELLTKQE